MRVSNKNCQRWCWDDVGRQIPQARCCSNASRTSLRRQFLCPIYLPRCENSVGSETFEEITEYGYWPIVHRIVCGLVSCRHGCYCYRVDVSPSVRPSDAVTRWYCVETAQPIVKLSSLPGSSMILVFWGPNFFPEFQWEHPTGGVKYKG